MLSTDKPQKLKYCQKSWHYFH